MLRHNIRPGDSVLDVGCGARYRTTCLKEILGAETTGLLSGKALKAVPSTVPYEWFDHLYVSHYLLVYELSEA